MAQTHETIADIRKDAEAKFRELVEAYMQRRAAFQTTVGAMQAFNTVFDRIDAAHKREVDALKQRCAELDAEVAAKDEVIKRLNDAISEEQRRKMATTENPSAVGDAAKLREVLDLVDEGFTEGCLDAPGDCPTKHDLHRVSVIREKVRSALAAPPRNCDVHTADELKAIFNSELVSELPIANEHEKNLVTITAMMVIDTLFATTKEGGNDADK